jgi:hypothetical protein
MLTNKQMQLVLAQNSPNFELELLENQALFLNLNTYLKY